jgi:hypothetical protein
LDSGESGTFPKVGRKEKNKNKKTGISEQHEENGMIFPKVTFTIDGI